MLSVKGTAAGCASAAAPEGGAVTEDLPGRVERLIRCAKPALQLAAVPLYDYYRSSDTGGERREEHHIFARGIVLVDRFSELPGIEGDAELGGRRLLLSRDGRLYEQLRVGRAIRQSHRMIVWRAGHDGGSGQTLPVTAAETAERWPLEEIARGIHEALVRAEDAQLGYLAKVRQAHDQVNDVLGGRPPAPTRLRGRSRS